MCSSDLVFGNSVNGFDISLYSLLGKKVNSFNDLAEQELPREQIKNYLLLSQKVNAHLRSYDVCRIDKCIHR